MADALDVAEAVELAVELSDASAEAVGRCVPPVARAEAEAAALGVAPAEPAAAGRAEVVTLEVPVVDGLCAAERVAVGDPVAVAETVAVADIVSDEDAVADVVAWPAHVANKHRRARRVAGGAIKGFAPKELVAPLLVKDFLFMVTTWAVERFLIGGGMRRTYFGGLECAGALVLSLWSCTST